MYIDIQALSGIFGSISIACWVVVFSPQIIENFRRSSAEGLSIVFLVIWLAGDIFNIVGAVLQDLLPTMIILAVYYALADIVLILQCFYYRGFTLKDTASVERTTAAEPSNLDEPNERSALLSHPTDGTSSPGMINNSNPMSQTTSRRSSFRDRLSSLDVTHLSPATPLHPENRDIAALKAQSPVQKRRPILKSIIFNSAAILVVCAAGVLGWWLSTHVSGHSHSGDDKDASAEGRSMSSRRRHHHHSGHKKGATHNVGLEFNLLGQIFGYICALLYLGSRLPQLLLNYRRKSTEGISMLFFLFACVGNLAYVLSILAYEAPCYRSAQDAARASCEPGEAERLYLRNFIVNFSWLLGSFGTLLLDAAVFLQWYWYRNLPHNIPQQAEEDEGSAVTVDGADSVRR